MSDGAQYEWGFRVPESLAGQKYLLQLGQVALHDADTADMQHGLVRAIMLPSVGDSTPSPPLTHTSAAPRSAPHPALRLVAVPARRHAF